MKRGYIAGWVIGLSMLLGACSETPAPAPDTSAADQKALKDGEVAWASDWAAKDLDKIVSHYADDADVLNPDTPIMKGKDAIRTGIGGLLTDKGLSLSFTTVSAQVSKGGDLGYTEGTYSMTMTNPKSKKVVTEKGKYVTVYKKQADGSWKAIEDINNADAPAAPVAVAKVGKKAPAPRKKKRG
jgi:uncharacterized protein (TIGR02246 family)